MAEEQVKQEEESKQEKPEARDEVKQEEKKGSLLQWIIMSVIIIVLAVAGFFVGDKLGSNVKPADAATDKKAADLPDDLLAKDATSGWYYDLDPVATNLSDPGSTRYVRAVLTLEMMPEADETQGRVFLDSQKPVIANILNIYFAGLTIEDINSDKDMRRIQYELVEIFNDSIYKNSKPLVKQILFREFGLQ